MRHRWPRCVGAFLLPGALLIGLPACNDAAIPASDIVDERISIATDASTGIGATDQQELKILAIGNSFSVNALQYVWEIASDLGFSSVKLGNLVIGGCTLYTHNTFAKADRDAYTFYTNSNGKWSGTASYKMSDAIQSDDWDFISLQQSSGKSGIADTYNADLTELADYVHQLAPNAKLVWHMTWAYAQNSTHSEFSQYGSDQLRMYQNIVSAVQEKVLTNRLFSKVIPSGTAIQNARTSYIGDTLTQDGHHLAPLGCYIAGLTYFHSLTGISLKDLNYIPKGLSAADQKIAIEAAASAVAAPFAVTDSVFTKAPA